MRARLLLSAAAFILAGAAGRASNLDLDDVDGVNTTTIAKQQRDIDWQSEKRFGAETVAGHNRNFANPDEIRVGNYIIAPEVGAAVVYNDNIFSSDLEKVGDFRSEITPSVRFISQLPRHVLDLSLDGKIVNYAEHPDQDYANARAKLDGALHFDSAHTISASILSSLSHEERNSPSYPFAARDPVEVLHNKAAVGITRDVGRLYGTITASAESWNFSDNVTLDGRPLDLTPRDTQLYSTTLRVGYRVSPGYEIVGKVRGLKNVNKGDGTTDYDALGYEALAGVAFQSNPLLRWRILGGFGVRDYEKAGMASLTTSLMEAEVEWLPTQRLTIYATLSRKLNDIGGPDGSSLLQTGLDLRADYEVYHNLLLNVGANIRQDSSDSLGKPELVYGGRIGLDYYLNKNWLFTFSYEHDVRESDSDSREMHRNRFMLGAKLRF
jgi:hypothetical protein